jgi:hypothetical protein
MSLTPNITGMVVANAKLPEKYQTAKLAIAECEHIDECKDWADKAEALASYAKQAGDLSLLVMAQRIQARAIRRCGDLLLEIQASTGGRPPKTREGARPSSRKDAAEEAGLSTHQRKTAVRVARVPTDEFEAAVESEEPPTVTQLASRGTRKQEEEEEPTFDLQGRDPEDFKLATQALGRVRLFVENVTGSDPDAVARGTLPSEWRDALKNVRTVAAWLTVLESALEKERNHQ